MGKKRELTAWVCVWIAAMALANTADARQVGCWKLDETGGMMTADSSGQRNDGAITGSPGWVTGKIGGAMAFSGDDSITLPAAGMGMGAAVGSVAFWMNAAAPGAIGTIFWAGDNTTGGGFGPENEIHVHIEAAGTYWKGGEVSFWTPSSFLFSDTGKSVAGSTPVNPVAAADNQWHHMAAAWGGPDANAKLYLDGVLLVKAAYSGATWSFTNVFLGKMANGSRIYSGLLDDVRVYDHALDLAEVQDAMRGTPPGPSSNPSPQDKTTDVVRDVTLGWKPGAFAKTHDVYFGTTFADVNNAGRANPAGVLASQGQDSNSFDPAGPLAFGQTYFWRVDEVNAPPTDSTIFKGGVWSFTAETYGFVVRPSKATTSSMLSASMGPEKTIDGSGLDALDQHSTSTSHMWTSKKGAGPIWVQYEFDKIYKLHQMWVWNSNQAVEPSVGFGAKEVVIQTSLDGSAWANLGGTLEFNQASGEPNYVANTIVDFAGVQAQYVRLTINTNWADSAKQAGLSEVRFFYVPVKAFGPAPGNGASGVAIDSVLSWRPGREAVKHEVYLSADASAVAGGTVPAKVVTEHSLALNALHLEYGKTYTWKVNEVNDAATPKSWEGDLWTLTTPDHGVVDDFESYNDTCNRVFFAWVDGFGHNGSTDCVVAPSLGNGSGSTVGNTNPPFAERTIIHGGKQSMPLAYDNTAGRSFSEATRTFEPGQDWTLGGAKTLVLYFRGTSENGSGQLYVKINGAKVDYPGPASSVTIGLWKQWNIDLASVGTNLAAVKTLAIGVAGSAKGTLYIDDIRLYRVAPEVALPADPGTSDLAAYYRMEADVKDSSGKGNHGTANGNPVYVDSLAGYGQAIQLEGIDDYVDLPIGTLINTLSSLTCTSWVNFSSTGAGWERIFDFGSGATNYMFLSPRQGTSGPLTFAIMTPTVAEKRFVAPNTLGTGWHTVAVVIDGAAMNVKVYVDGLVAASDSTTVGPKDLGETTQNWLGRSQFTADAFYNGILDEVRIYSRALSAGEVRFLAGDR